MAGGAQGDPAASIYMANVSFFDNVSGTEFVENGCIVRDVTSANRNCCAREPAIGTAEFAVGALRNDVRHVVKNIGIIASGGRGRSISDGPHYVGTAAPAIPRGVAYSVVTQPIYTTAHEIVAKGPRPGHSALRSIMLDFAEGVHEIHRHGYYHLDLSLANLVVVRGGRGLVRVTSGAVAAPTEKVYSKAPRALAYFRPPENFITSENGLRYANHKFDVWSLGICFLVLLTRRGVFRIADAPGLMPTRAIDALASYRTSPHANPAHAALFTSRECIAWQTLVLFGSFDPSTDPTGADRRKIYLKKSLHDAADRGDVEEGDVDVLVDLLFRMIVPDVRARATIKDVISHPAFAGYRKENEITNIAVPRIDCGVPPPRTLCAPISWTKEKDAIVVSVVRAALTNESARHLSAEAAFVTFDNTMRIAGALLDSTPQVVAVAVVAASARASLLLYDSSTSIYDFLGNDASTTSESLTRKSAGISVAPNVTHAAVQAAEPIVLEFLSNDLRRDMYFGKLYTEAEAIHLFGHMINPHGSEFRATYHTADPETVLTSRFGIARGSEDVSAVRALTVGRLVDLVKSYDELSAPSVLR